MAQKKTEYSHSYLVSFWYSGTRKCEKRGDAIVLHQIPEPVEGFAHDHIESSGKISFESLGGVIDILKTNKAVKGIDDLQIVVLSIFQFK